MSSDFEAITSLIKRILGQVSLDKSGRMKLPPERSLAESLDVQRAKLREALAMLEQFGFIQRVQGSGTFLEVPKPLFAQLYFEVAMQLNYISFETIEKAREMLERVIVQEAARNASDEEIRELGRLCSILVDSRDVELSIKADYDFHLLLSAMTRNPVMVILFQSLSSVLRDVLRQRRVLFHKSEKSSEIINRNHIAIVEAIKKRDPELALKAMTEHFSIWDQQYQLSTFMIGKS